MDGEKILLFEGVAGMLSELFDIDILIEVWPMLLHGLVMTLALAVLAIPLSAAAGLLLSTFHYVGNKWHRRIVIFYVDLLRSFPPLVLLIFIFYGLPMIGIKLNNFFAAVLALTLNGASYYAEIFRAGLEAVPPGQNEAARSTGLGQTQSLVYVVIPQGIRKVIPDLASNTLELFKLTSIASVVAIEELLRTAQIAQGLFYNPTPLLMAAIIYLALLWPLVRWISTLHGKIIIPNHDVR